MFLYIFICVIIIISSESFRQTAVPTTSTIKRLFGFFTVKISTMRTCLASSQLPTLGSQRQQLWVSSTLSFHMVHLSLGESDSCHLDKHIIVLGEATTWNLLQWWEPAIGRINKIQHYVRIKVHPTLASYFSLSSWLSEQTKCMSVPSWREWLYRAHWHCQVPSSVLRTSGQTSKKYEIVQFYSSHLMDRRQV